MNPRELEILLKKQIRKHRTLDINQVEYHDLVPRTRLCIVKTSEGDIGYGIAIRSKLDPHIGDIANNLSFTRALDYLME